MNGKKRRYHPLEDGAGRRERGRDVAYDDAGPVESGYLSSSVDDAGVSLYLSRVWLRVCLGESDVDVHAKRKESVTDHHQVDRQKQPSQNDHHPVCRASGTESNNFL